ncbi:MAG: TIGR00282 family metallophosphoesterase [Evtepia sp.]
MLFNLLAVGDVVSELGLAFLNRHLRTLQKQYKIDFTVVNGENAAGIGLLPRHAEEMFDAGADVITLGNHTWSKLQIADYLDETPAILRPANYAPQLPGRGFGVYDVKGIRVAVLNLMGRFELDSNLDSPFLIADKILKTPDLADLIVVDFHAEATSEKGALAWYLDGRAQAVWGTHTHVPTADCQILPKGCGFVTDLGMTGPSQSVIGIRPEISINRFLGGLPRRYEAAQKPAKLNAVRFTFDTETHRCLELCRCDIQE